MAVQPDSHLSYHVREKTPLWFEGAPLVDQGIHVTPLVPLKPVTFKRMRIDGRPLQPGHLIYFEMVNTTTRQAGPPRYTRLRDSLTITQTSADSVLRHNPL